MGYGVGALQENPVNGVAVNITDPLAIVHEANETGSEEDEDRR